MQFCGRRKKKHVREEMGKLGDKILQKELIWVGFAHSYQSGRELPAPPLNAPMSRHEESRRKSISNRSFIDRFLGQNLLQID